MSRTPSNPSFDSAPTKADDTQRAAFVVRIWRGAGEEAWRCHLIHVETGRHLPCHGVGQIGEQIEGWLRGVAQPGKGLR